MDLRRLESRPDGDEPTRCHADVYLRRHEAIIGRWLSEDPIGFGGGDANLYRYVGNFPINRRDPEGTCFHNFGSAQLDLNNPKGLFFYYRFFFMFERCGKPWGFTVEQFWDELYNPVQRPEPDTPPLPPQPKAPLPNPPPIKHGPPIIPWEIPNIGGIGSTSPQDS